VYSVISLNEKRVKRQLATPKKDPRPFVADESG